MIHHEKVVAVLSFGRPLYIATSSSASIKITLLAKQFSTNFQFGDCVCSLRFSCCKL